MIAAIEIYNKPAFAYRDECFVILLLNAWELLLKAIRSKSGRSIYYPKQRTSPYRTLSLADALKRAQDLFPPYISHLAVSENIRIITTYRDNAIHFYNKPGFASLVYALAQTSIVNYKDLLQAIFGMDLSREITIQILPLGLTPPVDPITYLQQPLDTKGRLSPAVSQFIREIRDSLQLLEQQGADTGRLLTVFNVKLESTKKLGRADILVGIGTEIDGEGPLVVERRVDPNISHPLRTKDVIERVGNLHSLYTTRWIVRVINWKYKIHENPRYCWRSSDNVLTKFSHDFVQFLKSLGPQEIEQAIADYQDHWRNLARTHP